MESFEHRLRRFLSHEDEIPLTLLSWAQNDLLLQVRVAKEGRLESLVFLSVHAFIQTFSEKVLGRRGHEATKFFLHSFMDEGSSDRNFSQVSDELHDMRNVMAHQLFSSCAHDIALDYTMSEGWRRDQTTLHVNPDVFANQFIACVDGGRLWEWRTFVAPEQRIKQQYLFIRDWLVLAKTDAIAKAVEHLAALTTLADIRASAAAVDALRHTLTGPSKGKTGDALVLRSLYPKIRLTTGLIRTDEIDIVRLTSPCGPDKH